MLQSKVNGIKAGGDSFPFLHLRPQANCKRVTKPPCSVGLAGSSLQVSVRWAWNFTVTQGCL